MSKKFNGFTKKGSHDKNKIHDPQNDICKNNKRKKFYQKKYPNKKNNGQIILLNNSNFNKNLNSSEFTYYINPNDLPKYYHKYTPMYDDRNNGKLDNTNYPQSMPGDYGINNILNSRLDYNLNPYYNSFIFTNEFEKNLIEMLNKEQELVDKDIDKIMCPKPKPYKWIKMPEIKNLLDLIEIGKSWGTVWTDDYEYNINLKLLNSLVPELDELNKMIGLHTVKMQIIDFILYWILGLDNSNHDLLHTVIDGEPGTGKTELAEKLASIYLKLGVLKNNIFKKVKRSDLIAGYLGQTAIKTTKILEDCKGGVLFIDEAYSLGNAEGKNGKDSFSKECIDILNQALTESKNDFICIIAGYKDDLEKSFFSYNSGLERRFPIRFSIGTYSDEELGKIFIKKVKEFNWDISTDDDKLTDIIKKNRIYFKFNGGDMETLFTKCKISHSKNLLKEENKIKKLIDEQDILDGIKLYLLNPEIKKRKDSQNIEKYMMETLYI